MKKYKLYSQALDKQDLAKKLKKQQDKEDRIKEQQRKIVEEKHKAFLKTVIPYDKLKRKFDYTCHTCGDYIIYDSLYLDDFTNKYVPLNPDTMRPHKHNWKFRKELKLKIKEMGIVH
jgi:hypothetical protein